MRAWLPLMSKLKGVLWNLGVAAVYLITGRLGLLLALENGYASPIWPPSGVALAAVLMRNTSVWPGLFLGAFLTNSNLGALFADPFGQLHAHPENLVIALGNSFQPVVGAWLLRRYAKFPNDLCATVDILRFYLYSGPIACITAATVGTLTLTAVHTILPASMPSTWLVWWVGDTNGVLILTPIILSIQFMRSSPRRFLTLATTLILAFSLTIVSSFQIRNWEHQKLVSILANQTQAARQALEGRLVDCMGTLGSLGTYLKLSEPCTRSDFESFATTELGHSDSISALSWNPLLERGERTAFEQRLALAYPGHAQILERRDGQMVPAAQSGRYVPVLFIFPLEENVAALGFNVWSDPKRHQAIARASADGSIEATAALHLVQNTASGILLFKPVYRATRLLGFATAVVRIPRLMDRAFSQIQAKGLHFRLVDASDGDSVLALYHDLETFDAKMLRADLRKTSEFHVGSRRWRLEVTASDTFVALHQDKSAWLLLLTGCLLTGVLGILILTVSGRELLTQRAIEERTHELTKANQAKSDFLANMSHEIRTPMNGIIAMADLLMLTKTTAEQREYLEIVRTSGSALLVIINDILDFSKIEAGKLTLENIPFDLHRIVEEVGELMAEAAHEKGLELAVVVDHKIPHGVMGDPGRLRQILLNLVSNAIKFTDQGHVALEVLLDEVYPRFLRLRFQIKDTGIGISLEHQRNLFRPFFQGDSSMTRKFGGTGLGLAICKQLVEKMGGTISLESNPGGGSCFRVRVPLQKDPTYLIPEHTEPMLAELPRILIVDPLPENRRALIELLKDFGMDADEAGDPREANLLALRSEADETPYKIIIQDSRLDLRHILVKATRVITGPLVMRDPQLRNLFLGKPVKSKALRNALLFALGDPHQPAEKPSIEVAPATRAPNSPVQADARILLVEDNRTNQKVATFMLKKLGFNCRIAENGLEALAAMAVDAYDLVLMDCQMPELDGFETTRRIRGEPNINRQVPIVAMTANALKGDRERCLEAGMNDYLAKPVKSSELEQVLRRFNLLPEEHN